MCGSSTAWRNTLEFTLLALVIGYAVPFFVAILLNELRHARGYLRVLVYLPVMLPPASALLLFPYFYNPQYGLFDHILRLLHLPTSQWVLQPGTGFISPQPKEWRDLAVAAEAGRPGSMLELYRAALRIRRLEPALGDGPTSWLSSDDGVLAFAAAARRKDGAALALACLRFPVPLLAVASAPYGGGQIPGQQLSTRGGPDRAAGCPREG